MEKVMATKEQRVIATLRKEIEDLNKVIDYQHAHAEKYSRYAERLRGTLDRVIAVQYEGLGMSEAWAVIDQIISESKDA